MLPPLSSLHTLKLNILVAFYLHPSYGPSGHHTPPAHLGPPQYPLS